MWFKIQEQYIIIRIIAKPNAKRTALLKITEQELHVAVHAKPQKGDANKELLVFLSQLFAVPKTKIILKTGEHSKYKQFMMPLTPQVEKVISKGLSLL